MQAFQPGHVHSQQPQNNTNSNDYREDFISLASTSGRLEIPEAPLDSAFRMLASEDCQGIATRDFTTRIALRGHSKSELQNYYHKHSMGAIQHTGTITLWKRKTYRGGDELFGVARGADSEGHIVAAPGGRGSGVLLLQRIAAELRLAEAEGGARRHGDHGGHSCAGIGALRRRRSEDPRKLASKSTEGE